MVMSACPISSSTRKAELRTGQISPPPHSVARTALEGSFQALAEDAIKDIRRATRRHFSAEDKIRIVLEGLRGEDNISELCRREGIASSMYYGWSKEFLEAGKKRLAGDTARAATSDEVKDLRREAQALKVGDGAYDRSAVSELLARRNPDMSVLVPPCKGAVPGSDATSSPTQRDRHNRF
jgi:transposase